MSGIYIIVLDDQKRNIDEISKTLKNIWSGIEILKCKTYEEVLKIQSIYKNKIRLACIGMKGTETDFESANKIREKDLLLPLIIFGNGELYKEAMNVYALGYLKFPVSKDELRHAIKPVQKMCEGLKGKTLQFKYRGHMYSVELDRIVYISSNLHTVYINLEDGTTLTCRSKLSEYEDQLNNTSFVRCHQSYWVNMDRITMFRKKQLFLDDIVIPISRAYSDIACNKYMRYLEENGRSGENIM